MDIFGDLYGAFEIAAEEGAESLIKNDISKEWAEAITEVAKKNISPPEVHITGYVDLKSYAGDGVEVIKEALLSVKDDNITIQCVGAPRYRMTVTSSDYIEAETMLKNAAQMAIDEVVEAGGEGEFYRELE
jgi:translation initiation factor 2 subunit 1